MIDYSWKYINIDTPSSEITKIAGSDILAKILYSRGIKNAEEAEKFLNPLDNEEISPYEFEDMPKAVERIYKAIENKEHIVVYGDFDADGVTGTSVLYKTLSHLGSDVSFYVPKRDEEGHGLDKKTLLVLKSKRKAKLIITVDCGISNKDEISLLNSFGCDVIITDHHEAPEELPEAFAIINPKISHDGYLRDLAGVGVAYKLCEALLDVAGEKDFENELLPLVCIGTIADVVPLSLENRTLVCKGLKAIKDFKPRNIGLILERAASKFEAISSEIVAFRIAPRINAVGRLSDASLAVEFFTSNDEKRLEEISMELELLNAERQDLCEKTFQEAIEKINEEDLNKNTALILHNDNWHVGIVGISASKLCERFYRPVFLITINEETKTARCSARSIEGLNLYEVLYDLKDNFKVFGGHAMAAGFCMDLEEVNFTEFLKKLHQKVNEKLSVEDIRPSIHIDLELNSDDISFDFVKKINELEPFGGGNPRPVFALKDMFIQEYKVMKNKHLKAFLKDNSGTRLECVWWGVNEIDVDPSSSVDIAFKPSLNEFNGNTTIQLELIDLKGQKVLSEENVCMLVDHRKRRNETEKLLLNHLRTSLNNVFIYAERKDTIESLSEISDFKNILKTRFDMPAVSDDIILVDFPPEKDILRDFYKKTKTIHFVGKIFPSEQSCEGVLNRLSGMLKYAHNNRGGEVNIIELASKIPASQEATKKAINILVLTRTIKALSIKGNILKFEYKNPLQMEAVDNMDEYKKLKSALEAERIFHKKLEESPIEQIKEFLATKTPL